DAICAILSGTGLPIVDEESPDTTWKGETPAWIVDPLDGSINAIVGNEEFCVSVALLDVAHAPLIGVIVAPALDWSIIAVKGEGVSCDGVWGKRALGSPKTMIASYGIPDDGHLFPEKSTLFLAYCWRNGWITRQSGSAVLDLARVGTSQWSLFFEDGL